MTDNRPLVNPLFAPSRRAANSAAKIGGYGRRHGGGRMAGHCGGDRLWNGRGRHDRHVLGHVHIEFGEFHVDQ